MRVKVPSQEHCGGALPSDRIIEVVAIPSGSVMKDGQWSRKPAQMMTERSMYGVFLLKILYTSTLKLLVISDSRDKWWERKTKAVFFFFFLNMILGTGKTQGL